MKRQYLAFEPESTEAWVSPNPDPKFIDMSCFFQAKAAESDQEKYGARLVMWFSDMNLQSLRRRIAYLEQQRAALTSKPDEKPADDNPPIMSILYELGPLSKTVENIEKERAAWARGEESKWQESPTEPPSMDPAWTQNDSSSMDASWFTNCLVVDDLRADDDESAFKPLLDAYRDGDELWEFANPASRWYIDCVCIGVALVRHGKVVEKLISITS